MNEQIWIIVVVVVVAIIIIYLLTRNPIETFNPNVWPSPSPSQVLTDDMARRIEQVWKEHFPDATILPVIGYPSNSGGVVTLTHSMGTGHLLHINGLPSKSPLSNNALYSAEISNGRYLNLYEIMIPDIPGANGCPSTAQVYVNALYKLGLTPSGTHFHWYGASLGGPEKMIAAIHHQNIGMDPIEFARRTSAAIKIAMDAIQQASNQ